MAIKRYAGDRFTGLSTDVKPSNILSGVQFTELDTGKIFFYNGTSWIESTVEMIGGDGINITGETVSVDLATNPGLQFTSNKLDVKIKTNHSLGKDADGLFVPSSIAGSNLTWDNGVINALDPYVHPTGFVNAPTARLTGAAVIDQVTVDDNGHVTGVLTRDLQYDNILGTPTAVSAGDAILIDSENVISVDSTIAGNALEWDHINGIINAYTHPTGAPSTTVTDVDVLRSLTINGEGHVTDITTGALPVGSAADATNYTRIAPLDNNNLVPLSYIPNEAKSSKVVATIAARDAIPSSDRFEGLRVHVIDATDDATVDLGHAGYIMKAGLLNSDWVKTYEEEILDIHVPTASGSDEAIQLSDGTGNFTHSANFNYRVTGSRLEMTGGFHMKAGGTIPTVTAGEAHTYIETEVVGSDTITRVMTRLGDATDVILASYIETT